LFRFNFTLKYVPETKIRKTDKLSRQPDWKVSVEKDNDNQVFIKDCWLCSLSEIVTEGPKVDILEKIKIARSRIRK